MKIRFFDLTTLRLSGTLIKPKINDRRLSGGAWGNTLFPDTADCHRQLSLTCTAPCSVVSTTRLPKS